MNLLIVNDERRTADLMKSQINWKDYEVDAVFTAYDTEMAKLVIQENTVDLLLCDIEMPGENGLSLLRWVRQSGYDMECIFLTCHANFAYAQEAISLGCQDYILIPARYEDIGKAVHKLIKKIQEKRKDAQYQEYGKAYFNEKIKKGHSHQEKSLSPEQIQAQVKEYIMLNISDSSMTVNSISSQFHFHPVYLNRVFKQQQGTTVSQYIINERMKLAASLLTAEATPASQVAEQVGYSYYANFHNMFKRFYGCTPVQYQENYQKGAKL